MMYSTSSNGLFMDLNSKDQLDALIAFAQRNNRVCPQPRRWNHLYNLVVATESSVRNPLLPLILGGWWHSTSEVKQRRLIEHLRFAEAVGTLQTADDYLRSLAE